MEYPRIWETINEDKEAGSTRLKIHGGWLVVSWCKNGSSEPLIFIPDPAHQWELEPK